MAGSINKVVLVGRLGQDPKLTFMPNGNAVCEMSVATDESYKDREGNKVEQTEWHRVKSFGKTAEFCGNYLTKGRLVYVEGMIKTRSWEKDGQKHYATEVVVSAPGHTIQGLDRAPNGEAPAARAAAQDEPQGKEFFPSESTGLEDVPFAMMLAPLCALGVAALNGWFVA